MLGFFLISFGHKTQYLKAKKLHESSHNKSALKHLTSAIKLGVHDDYLKLLLQISKDPHTICSVIDTKTLPQFLGVLIETEQPPLAHKVVNKLSILHNLNKTDESMILLTKWYLDCSLSNKPSFSKLTQHLNNLEKKDQKVADFIGKMIKSIAERYGMYNPFIHKLSNKRLSCLPKTTHWNRKSKKRAAVYLEHAIILNAMGFYSKSYKSVNQAFWLNKEIAADQYFSLTHTITRINPTHVMSDKRVSSIYKQLQKHKGTFAELIRNQSFCIVGNSPCELGKRQGKIIDSFDIVIRFNEYPETHPEILDYGKKTDIWAKAPRYREITPKNNKFKLILVATSVMNNEHCANGHELVEDHIESDSKVELLPDTNRHDLRLMGIKRPSIGLCLVYWIYKLTGPIPKSQVFGFMMTDQHNNTSNSISGKSKIKRERFPHDWQKEKRFYRLC